MYFEVDYFVTKTMWN